MMKVGGPPHPHIPSTSGTGRFCLALEERLVACDHKELGRQKDALSMALAGREVVFMNTLTFSRPILSQQVAMQGNNIHF
jgi:hypothetical protein